jgi:hypothetical protein
MGLFDTDLAEYCQYEGARRNVPPETIYGEEMEARAWLEKNTPTNEQLMRLADASSPNIPEGDEECPFETR